MDETQPTQAPLPSQIVSHEAIITPEPQLNGEQPRMISFDIPLHENNTNVGITIPSLSLQERKIQATSARRKGVYVLRGKSVSSSSQLTSGSLSRTRGRVYTSENIELIDEEDALLLA